MNQLVELGKNANAFTEAGAEVIAVFREEKEEVAGLQKIVNKTKTTFTLALDNGKKQTPRYSAGRREFTGYVINPKGVITKVFEGDLRNRAKSAELIDAVKATMMKKEGSNSKGSDSKKEASATKGSESKASSTKGSATKGSATKGSDAKPAGSGNK